MAQQSKSNILLEVGTNELEVITFYIEWIDPDTKVIHKNTYGINAAKVRELVAYPDNITEVVNSISCVKGVFLLRNNTIPLIDLCDWFSYQTKQREGGERKWVVIVADLNGKAFGFITHGVDKVYRFSWSQISPPPELIASSQSITGICQVDDLIIQMIDFERIVGTIDPTMVVRSYRDQADARQIEEKYDRAVLVVDDSRVVLIQLTRTLEHAGFKVIPMPDGQAAFEFLEDLRKKDEVNKKILAIISDIEMPRMDGHHLCLRVKQQPAYNKIPLILFSSMITDALRRKGEAVGADDQVTKPELDKLIDRMHDCIARLEKA
ncbi:MAG: chemotaxis protein CheV [Deltaproteobacteria bacterium]|nr:chemotaxis protein CheV [Deltaproteobacteria bacterium]